MIRALALMVLADMIGLMVVGAIVLLAAAGWQLLTGGVP
jgi:hypothetical protein